jgi:proteasome lid subunit RPN8/RPN11
MSTRLIVEPAATLDMINYANTTYPNECCGFIYGSTFNDLTFIVKSRAVYNASNFDKRRHFNISSNDYMAAEEFASQSNLILLGVYHSHPNQPAIPSYEDKLFAIQNFLYIIISVSPAGTSDVKCWSLNKHNNFLEQPINISTIEMV